MKKLILIITMVVSTLIMQGCKQGMDLQPQDYFDGQQLTLPKPSMMVIGRSWINCCHQ